MRLEDEILTLFNEIDFSYHQVVFARPNSNERDFLCITNKTDNTDPDQVIFGIEYLYLPDGFHIKIHIRVDKDNTLSTVLIEEKDIINRIIDTVNRVKVLGIERFIEVLKKKVKSH